MNDKKKIQINIFFVLNLCLLLLRKIRYKSESNANEFSSISLCSHLFAIRYI